jgi:hypothetical protein
MNLALEEHGVWRRETSKTTQLGIADRDPAGQTRDPSERRRTPRIRVINQMAGCDIGANLPILVRDVSLGGFLIETAHAIPSGVLRTFAFTLADGTTHVLQARSVRTASQSDSGQSLHEVGFEFLANPRSQAAVARLLEHATSGTPTRSPQVVLEPTGT